MGRTAHFRPRSYPLYAVCLEWNGVTIPVFAAPLVEQRHMDFRRQAVRNSADTSSLNLNLSWISRFCQF